MTPRKSTISAPVAAAPVYDLDQIKADAAARRTAKANDARSAILARYPHVVSVSQMGPTGPVRVVIACQDPQTRQGVAICENTRDIAVQDAFQVRCCAACADRKTKLARRAKAKVRAKADRAAARAAKAE